MQRVGRRRWLAARKLRVMRIVTRGTRLVSHRSNSGVPEAAGAPMHAGFPISISRAMATAAQGRAVGNVQLSAIARLKSVEFVFVMTVEAVVVAAMCAVTHHDVLMLGGDDDYAVGVVSDYWWFALLMAYVTIEIGRIGASCGKELSRRNPSGGGAEEICIYKWNLPHR